VSLKTEVELNKSINNDEIYKTLQGEGQSSTLSKRLIKQLRKMCNHIHIYIYIYKITDVKFIKNIPHLIFNFPNYKVLAMTFFQSRNFHKTYKTTKLCIIFNTFNNRSNYFINKAGLQIFSSKYRLKVVL